ncbi:MAG: thiolase family protein [Dehalococcoidia bacterium]
MGYDLARLRRISDRVAVVGIGETDYARDYEATRQARQAGQDESGAPDSYALGAIALQRALADCALAKTDIDGLAVGGPISHQRLCESLGISPIWGAEGPVDQLIPQAAQAIASGACTTVALVYGNQQRGAGPRAASGGGPDQPLSTHYYHPWGWSSQGAIYAMMFKAHQLRYGSTEEQLGTVSRTIRDHAALNDNAIMRTPITEGDYENARYICRPLKIYDYCMVNDGGAALILTTRERAADLPKPPVLVSGFGRSSSNTGAPPLSDRIFDLHQHVLHAAGTQCFEMAEMAPVDVDHFQTYDAFSIHLPLNLEGFGFCGPGEGLAYVQEGRIAIGGELPCNTGGGMLAESSVQGWNHQVEAVRQLRHDAGKRQVEDARTSMFGHHGAAGAFSIMYRRGDR